MGRFAMIRASRVTVERAARDVFFSNNDDPVPSRSAANAATPLATK